MIDRDKVSYNIINNITKAGKNHVEIVRKMGKRTELGDVGKKVMANPFIFSIGGVSGDQTFQKGKKIFEAPIKTPAFFSIIDAVDHRYDIETKPVRIEPSVLRKAGKPSKYVYLN